MPLGTPKSGFGAAGEFQSSALPYVTSSVVPAASTGVLRIDFPNVTRFISIANRSADGTLLRVGFTENGVLHSGFHYNLDGQDTATWELRVKTLFLAGETSIVSASVMAGLTTVSASDMPLLSGALPDGSAGWTGVG